MSPCLRLRPTNISTGSSPRPRFNSSACITPVWDFSFSRSETRDEWVMRGLARARSVADVILNVVYLSELLTLKWRSGERGGEERRGREFVTWLRSFPLVSFEVRNFLIISFIFVIIIEEKFLDLILKSLIIYRARVLSYFIDNSIGILSNMLVLWNLLFKSFILFSDYYNYTMF